VFERETSKNRDFSKAASAQLVKNFLFYGTSQKPYTGPYKKT
jgi:hypothetical protein